MVIQLSYHPSSTLSPHLLHMYSKHYYFKNKIYIQSLLLLHAVAPQSPLVSTLVSLHSSLNSNQKAPSKMQ